MVDEIIVSIGINDKKLTYFSLEKRLEAIRNLYKDTPRVKVMSYNSLTVDFAKEMGARFILRGIRLIGQRVTAVFPEVVASDRWRAVHPGDSIAFDSSTPHRIWNLSEDRPMVAIWTVVGRDGDPRVG